MNGTISFADLDEDLSVEGSGQGLPGPKVIVKELKTSAVELIEEKCPACAGTGRYRYMSSHGQACFKCKGKGVLFFRRSAAERANAREAQARYKTNKAAEAVEAFRASHPAEHAWLALKAPTSSFAQDLLRALGQYGHLSERQIAAVTKCVAQDAERAATQAERIATAPTVDITPLITAFNTARSKGIKNPAMLLDVFKFKAAPLTGNNPGAIYVTENEQYLGKINDGKLTTVSTCSQGMRDKIVQVCASPLESAIAFGRRTGHCSCCGRELTNGESIDLGIGPICRERFGM